MGNNFIKKFFCFFIVAIAAIVQCGCTNALNFRHAYDQGVKAYNEKNYESAIVYFNNALSYKPESYSTLCLLGTSYAYNKDDKMAERTFQDAIRLFPDDWNAYILYADLKRSQHDYPAAIDFYETAITLGSMGGKEKAYYKKLLKEIAIEEAAYDAKNSFASDMSEDSFKANVEAKKKLLEKQDKTIDNQTGDVVLALDLKKWEKAIEQKDDKSKLVEYGIKGEDVKNFKWTQLVIVQYFVLSDNFKTTLDEYYKNHIGSVEAVAKNSNKTFEKKIIHQKNNEITYEWKFDNSKEAEISRIVYTDKGIYHIHFAKKGAFTDQEKAKYLDLLKTAVLK